MTASVIAPDKLAWLRTIRFRKGAGHGTEGYCVEEALACALGLPVSDKCPDCVDQMLHAAAIRANDSGVWESDAERTDALLPLLLAQPGTRTDNEAVKMIRRAMLVDFATKRAVPAWLRRAKMEKEALRCEALPSWTLETRDEIRTVMREVRAAAATAAAAAAAAYAAAAARLLAKELLREFIAVLIAACAVRVSGEAKP